jgi:hypothetical protein
MVKYYYLKTGVTIITEVDMLEVEVGKLLDSSFPGTKGAHPGLCQPTGIKMLHWVRPTEVGYMPGGMILRPLFSSSKDFKFIPNPNVLKNDVILESEASDGTVEHYKRSIKEILEKMEEVRQKNSGIIIPKPDGFRLPGPK